MSKPTSKDIALHGEVHETLTGIKTKLEELYKELGKCSEVSAESECSGSPLDSFSDAIAALEQRIDAIAAFLATHDKE